MRLFLLVMFAYVYHIKTTSGSSPLNIVCDYSEHEAMITYTGDAFGVLAIKSNGDMFWFEEDISTASFHLNALYEQEEEGDGDKMCTFDRGTFSIYTLTVQSRKTFKNFESIGDEYFTVECNFETFVSDIVGRIAIENPIIVPTLISQVKGSQSYANFTIKVVKMDGGDLADGPVALGRLVKLKVEMTPNETEEVGFRTTGCYAMTDDMSIVMTILAAGCGTGSPFAQTEGFNTTGFVAFSPTFRMFRMKKGQGTTFGCSFVICSSDCSGNSCPDATTRKKRDVSEIMMKDDYGENIISDNSVRSIVNREKRDVYDKYRNAIGANITKVVTSTNKLLYMPGIDGDDNVKIPFSMVNLTDNQDSGRVLKESYVETVSRRPYLDNERSSYKVKKKTLSSRLVVHVTENGSSMDKTGPTLKDMILKEESSFTTPLAHPAKVTDSDSFRGDKHLTNIGLSTKQPKLIEKNNNIVVNEDLISPQITESEKDGKLNDDLTIDDRYLGERNDVPSKEKDILKQNDEKQKDIGNAKNSVNFESKDKKVISLVLERLKELQTKTIVFLSVASSGLAGLLVLALIVICVVIRRHHKK